MKKEDAKTLRTLRKLRETSIRKTLQLGYNRMHAKHKRAYLRRIPKMKTGDNYTQPTFLLANVA